jgi:hypothetical protein
MKSLSSTGEEGRWRKRIQVEGGFFGTVTGCSVNWTGNVATEI